MPATNDAVHVANADESGRASARSAVPLTEAQPVKTGSTTTGSGGGGGGSNVFVTMTVPNTSRAVPRQRHRLGAAALCTVRPFFH